jgi:hypothetical protein
MQHDHRHTAVARLRGAVDDRRAGNLRQLTVRINRKRTSRDREGDRVFTGLRVGLFDRIA